MSIHALAFVPIALSGPAGASGLGELHVPVSVDPGFAGLDLFVQAYLIDVGSATIVVQTNGLEVAYP